MKGVHLKIRGGIGSLMLLAITLAALLLLKDRSDELWKDMPSRVFPNQMVNPSLLHQRPKTPEMLECSSNATCTPPPPPSWFFNFSNKFDGEQPQPESCPFYFKWIIADLWPWKETGITLEMVEEAKPIASFRLMIVDGRLFAEIYHKCFQTRDYFTIWGFSQLLKLYSGMVPDLDLMFYCEDKPLVTRFDYKNNQTSKNPPPLFHYCGHPDFYDIAFPDWSYWGWAEVRSAPWEILLREIRNGSQEVKWVNRNPVAYWKGNPTVAKIRTALMECSKIPNWNGELIEQDWNKEVSQGFKKSKLSEQCKHRYKIYIEGNAWSVSLKNIIACNSPTLLIRTQYYEFFQRGLVPHKHYLPVSSEKMCESVNTTVNWGNSRTEEISWGEEASRTRRNQKKPGKRVSFDHYRTFKACDKDPLDRITKHIGMFCFFVCLSFLLCPLFSPTNSVIWRCLINQFHIKILKALAIHSINTIHYLIHHTPTQSKRRQAFVRRGCVEILR